MTPDHERFRLARPAWTPPPWTSSPQPHRPGLSKAGGPQVLSGLGLGEPVIYASGPVSPGAKERLVRRLLAGLPGEETPGTVA